MCCYPAKTSWERLPYLEYSLRGPLQGSICPTREADGRGCATGACPCSRGRSVGEGSAAETCMSISIWKSAAPVTHSLRDHIEGDSPMRRVERHDLVRASFVPLRILLLALIPGCTTNLPIGSDVGGGSPGTGGMGGTGGS